MEIGQTTILYIYYIIKNIKFKHFYNICFNFVISYKFQNLALLNLLLMAKSGGFLRLLVKIVREKSKKSA